MEDDRGDGEKLTLVARNPSFGIPTAYPACSKPKTKPKKGKTGEEKKLRRKAKYFLATQLVVILVFLPIFGGHDDSEIELEDDNDGLHSD